MNIQKNIDLKDYTSWLVGGKAEFFCQPMTEDDFQHALSWAHAHQKKVSILGGGSNVLVSDLGVQGLVIHLRKYTGLSVVPDPFRLKLICMSGTGKNELLKVFLKYKLAPALFLAGLPGDVGGGVVMNAGVSESFIPREFGEIVDWVEVFVLEKSGEIKKKQFYHDEIQWTYRHSLGWQPGYISRVGISYPLEPDDTILEKVKSANRNRLLKQPLDKPSCGSVFVNPMGYKAAQLIDQCGLKGYRIGGAEVSLKHANFIVNTGSATAQDLWQVIQYVRSQVLLKTGVQLSTEVVMMGDWGPEYVSD